MSPKVSIVILNWNGRKYLQQFLPSVLATTYSNCEIIVADNGSTDDSAAWLQQYYPQVRMILLPKNGGFSKGYNDALREVAADYYVLLNSDVAVQPGWVEPVIELMETDTRIGACQPKILMERERGRFEYAGAAGGWIDSFGYPFARGRIFDHCEEDNGQYDDVAAVFWASGAAMFVRAAAYHGCGGLDEYFFAHMEEIDLCWRMQLQGHRIMVCPKSVVYHVGGGTLPKGNARKVYLNFRNNLIMLFKNLPAAALVWKLPFRLMLDALTAWKALLAGDGSYFIAVWKAHLGFVRWLVTHGRRSPGRSSGTALTGWWNKSVVWCYFIQRKTKFSEIVGHKPVKYKQ
ncbi:MAG: glycosyltransferase family 2 protein [Chitinophagaceae bacterium]